MALSADALWDFTLQRKVQCILVSLLKRIYTHYADKINLVNFWSIPRQEEAFEPIVDIVRSASNLFTADELATLTTKCHENDTSSLTACEVRTHHNHNIQVYTDYFLHFYYPMFLHNKYLWFTH